MGGEKKNGRASEHCTTLIQILYAYLSHPLRCLQRERTNIFIVQISKYKLNSINMSHIWGGDAHRPVAFGILKREERNKTSPYVSTHMTVLKREERHKTSPYVSPSTTPITVLKREEHNKTSPCVFSSPNANNCTKKEKNQFCDKMFL